MKNLRIIMPEIIRYRQRKARKEARRDARKARWANHWAKVNARWSAWRLGVHAKKVVKFLRKNYKQNGLDVICISNYEFSFALLPVLNFLQSKKIITPGNEWNEDSPEFSICITDVKYCSQPECIKKTECKKE